MSTPVTVAETQEKIHRSKTKQADPQSGYLEEKIVGSEYVNITEDDGAVGKRLVVSLDASAIQAVSDHKVAVDVSDTANYLENKIIATSGVAVAPDGTNPKTMKITGAYVAGAGISITGTATKTIASTITQVVTEDPFTGHATKVPTSKAVADLLKALTVTSATDCGSGGDPIMQKTQYIPASAITVAEKVGRNTIFSGDYPYLQAATLADCKWDTTAGCRSFNGMVKIESIDGGSAEEETSSFVIAMIPFGINEDAVGTNFWVDILFYCPATTDEDETTVVGAFPFIFVGNGTDQPIPGSLVEKTINYDDAVGKVVYKTCEFARGTTSTTASGCIVVMVNITDSNNFDAQILSARVRYETKTINLRTADVYEEV